MIKKEREIDKDTVVAYHARVQNQIKDELNGLNLGPGRFPMLLAAIFYLGGLALGVIGVLVITLRHRHVYLISWNDQFLGPAFIVLFILCVGMGTYMVLLALRRTNQYRRGLVFRPIGDYGVAVTHKSRLNYEHETKEQLKSGTTPHDSFKPLATYTAKNDKYGRPLNDGYDNQGYKNDPRGPPPRYSEKPRDDRRGPPRNRDEDRSRGDRPRGPPGDRYRDDRNRPSGPDDRRRGPPGDRYGDDRDRRGPPRGPPRGPRDPNDPDRRGPPRDPRDPDRRGPPRDPRDPDRRGPPRGPPRDPRDPDRRRDPRDDERRRQEDRRRYDDDRNRSRPEKVVEAGEPLLEKPPLPMAGPRPPVPPTDTVVFSDNADVSSESIL